MELRVKQIFIEQFQIGKCNNIKGVKRRFGIEREPIGKSTFDEGLNDNI